MKQIIAIGGGGFGRIGAKLTLESYLLKQTKKSNPKVGFLPQATGEDPSYINRFFEAFLSLGAKPKMFSLFGRVEQDSLQELLNQDLIYVGGGNTKSMLALWRSWGVDKLLKQAYETGIVLSGVSAGAICWFEQGVTDSVWPLGVLDCLSFLPGSCCPHYDTEPERRPFCQKAIVDKSLKSGIALEDNAAAHYIDGSLSKIFSANNQAKGYYISEENQQFQEMPQ